MSRLTEGLVELGVSTGARLVCVNKLSSKHSKISVAFTCPEISLEQELAAPREERLVHP